MDQALTAVPPVQTAAAPAGRSGRVPTWRLAGFSLLAAPVAAAGMPLSVYVPAIYAQHYGLSLATIGFVFLFGRVWDAMTDPLVGALTDRTNSRFGRRRPWIAAGGLVFGLATIALFFPPEAVTPLRFGIALFFFYLGWTMMQIPFYAWSAEMSGRYHERTRIVSYQTVVTASALLAVLILPTAIDQLYPGDAPLKLAAMGCMVLAVLVPAVILSMTVLPEPPPPPPAPRLPFARALTLVLSERLLLRVLASDFAVTFGQYVRGTLFVFVVASYMGRPGWASGLFLLQFSFATLAAPIWLRVGYRLGKHRTAVLGELVQAVINAALLLVSPGAMPLLIALTIAQGLSQNSGHLMLRSIVADIGDKHRLETGADRSGLFFSVFSISGKAGIALAVGVSLPLVALLGFEPKGVNSAGALQGLLAVFALGPALAHLISALIIRGFPLDEERQVAIRRALEERDAIAEVRPS